MLNRLRMSFRKIIRACLISVLCLGGLLGGLVGSVSSAFAVTVTVSIPPLAGMVAPLLGEGDQLNVLLKPGISPHGFQLRPSHLGTLQRSDLVLFVGGGVDAWIEKPVQSMTKSHIKMISLSGLTRLPVRAGGLWIESVDRHAQDDGHSHHHGEHSETDNHIWLSLPNVMLMVQAVSQQLQSLMPEQAQVIQQRERRWLSTLRATDQQVMQLLTPVKDRPFLVLHDAFQYFEAHYQLKGVGTIRLNPELPPSLKRIHQLREQIKAGKVGCVFKEPQFSEKRLQAVISKLPVRVGTLDPMGQFILQRTSRSVTDYVLYDAFLKQMANAFVECLAEPKGK